MTSSLRVTRLFNLPVFYGYMTTNKVMKNYLKLKHSSIYEECCEFYEYLNERNPQGKDLTKTTAYKKWARSQQTNERDDEAVTSPVRLVTFTIKDPELQSETITFSGVVEEEVQTEAASETSTFSGVEEEVQSEAATCSEVVQGTDPLSAAIQDLFSPVYEEFNDLEFNQVDNVIAEIINDLEQDEAVRNLLNVEENNQDQDEGIGLNLEDEIEEDFNFDEEFEFYY